MRSRETWACHCCHGQPAIKPQDLTQDPDSGLPDWLLQCADLHCDLKRLSFIFRSWRSASNKGQNTVQVPPQVCVTNAHRKMIYHLRPHKTHSSGENESVAFFLYSVRKGIRKKTTAGAAPFTKDRLAVLSVFVVVERNMLPQLYSQ